MEIDCGNMRPGADGSLRIPESWDIDIHKDSHNGVPDAQIEYEYDVHYYDCSLQAAKQEMSLSLEMDCERQYREGQRPSMFANGTVISPEPGSFGMVWPDRDHCDLSMRYTVYPDRDDDPSRATIVLNC